MIDEGQSRRSGKPRTVPRQRSVGLGLLLQADEQRRDSGKMM